MKTIVDNLAVEYFDEGQGPTLLMLHGWMDKARTFDSLAHELQGFRIVRLDMPGFGASERPKEVWGVGEYASFVAHFLEKINIGPYVLVGHSFGGRVAIKGAGTHVLKPEKLVLIDSAGVVHSVTIRRRFLRFIAKVGRGITTTWPFSIWRNRLRKKLYAAIGSDYYTAGPMRDTYLKVIGENLLPYAERIQIPTLLVWGSNDAATPLVDGRKIHETITGSRLEVVDGASHFVHWEHPAEVASFIKSFV